MYQNETYESSEIGYLNYSNIKCLKYVNVTFLGKYVLLFQTRLVL